MNGFLFYWISWIFWIIITFFMKKRQLRTVLACWVLFTIIASSQYIVIGTITISVACMILVLGAVFLICTKSFLYYHLFCSLTIAIGYAALLFFEQVSPVWIIAPRFFLYSILLATTIRIIGKNYYSQLSICILGMISGEILYRITLTQYGMFQLIGEFHFLDTLSTSLLIITILDILQREKRNISNLIENYQ